jgi:outer membrane immunogenic protein
MRRFSFAGVAAVSTVALGQVASAADLPVKAPPPLVAPAPVSSWTGWYVGLNAGWVGANADPNTNAVVLPNSTTSFPINDANIAATATNQFNNRSNGFLGGAQFGYNYQFSPLVVAGLEADIQGSTANSNASITSTRGGDLIVFTRPFWVTTTTVSNRLDYLGTLRARLGVTWTPSFLLYATGGLAYGGVKSSTSLNFNNTDGAVPGSSFGSFSGTRTGWTAGGGVEWMFVRNWSAKLEYLHYDLGSVTYATGGYAVDVGPSTFAGTGIASVGTTTTVHFNGDIVRAGVNYHF